MTLTTREPSRRAGLPRILLDGEGKSGKAWALAELSASPEVGRTVVIAVGENESKWDELGLIPGARFEIAVHDGTWPSVLSAVEAAWGEAEAARDAGEPPFVLGITVSPIWEGLKDWRTLRARSSKKALAVLEQDPDACIEVDGSYWDATRARWRALMRHVLTFPGIVVLIARGGPVTLYSNGQPVAGQAGWSTEAEKNLTSDASVHIRLSRDARPILVGARGVQCQIRPGIDPPRRLPDDWTLEQVIFGTLQLDPATAQPGVLAEYRQDLTPMQVLAEAKDPATTLERVRALYTYAKRAFPGATVPVPMVNGRVRDVQLLQVLKVEGEERSAAAAAPEAASLDSTGAAEAGAGDVDPVAEEAWVTAFYERLEGSASDDDYSVRRSEIESALASREITEETAAVLREGCDTRAEAVAAQASSEVAEPAAGELVTV